jgi:hypothetical protein
LLELIKPAFRGIKKELAPANTTRGIGVGPIIGDPGPRPVIDVDEVLVVKMYSREIPFIQECHSRYS